MKQDKLLFLVLAAGAALAYFLLFSAHSTAPSSVASTSWTSRTSSAGVLASFRTPRRVVAPPNSTLSASAARPTARARAALLAAFAGDAVSLSYEWEYKQAAIPRAQELAHRWRKLAQPHAHFLARKTPGELTMYGDTALLLARASVVGLKPFDAQFEVRVAREFLSGMHQFFGAKSYRGWRTHAVKDTVAKITALGDVKRADDDSVLQVGSASDDTSPVGRAAVLLLPFVARAQRGEDVEDAYVHAVETLVRVTHRDSLVCVAARYFARVLFALAVRGDGDVQRPEQVLRAVLQRAEFKQKRELQRVVTIGLRSTGKDTRKALKGFGLGCSSRSGIPGAVHIIAKYPDDLATALAENLSAGGDSAARAMIAGAVIAAYLGPDAVPAFEPPIQARAEIEQLADKLLE